MNKQLLLSSPILSRFSELFKYYLETRLDYPIDDDELSDMLTDTLAELFFPGRQDYLDYFLKDEQQDIIDELGLHVTIPDIVENDIYIDMIDEIDKIHYSGEEGEPREILREFIQDLDRIIHKANIDVTDITVVTSKGDYVIKYIPLSQQNKKE